MRKAHLISLVSISLGVAVHKAMLAQTSLSKVIKDLNHPRYQNRPTSPKPRFKKRSKL